MWRSCAFLLRSYCTVIYINLEVRVDCISSYSRSSERILEKKFLWNSVLWNMLGVSLYNSSLLKSFGFIYKIEFLKDSVLQWGFLVVITISELFYSFCLFWNCVPGASWWLLSPSWEELYLKILWSTEVSFWTNLFSIFYY